MWQWIGSWSALQASPCTVPAWRTKTSDLDYADDIALHTDLMELRQLALEVFAAEAARIELVVNWKKTKIQALMDFLPPIGDLDIGGEQVKAVTSFTYLGVTTHSSCRRGQEISRRLGIARSSFRDMDHIRGSRLALLTTFRLQCLHGAHRCQCF